MYHFESFPRPTQTYHSTTYDRIARQHGFDGRDKTVLITGGATGVGYSISKAFAEAGVARIPIISRSLGPQEKNQNPTRSRLSHLHRYCHIKLPSQNTFA